MTPQEQWMEDTLDKIIRDYTSIDYPKTKSELRRRLTTQIELAEKRGESKILQQVGILRQLVAEIDMTKDEIYEELDNICPLDPHGFIPQMAASLTNHN